MMEEATARLVLTGRREAIHSHFPIEPEEMAQLGAAIVNALLKCAVDDGDRRALARFDIAIEPIAAATGEK